MFRKLLDEGQAGDNVGLLLRGVEKTDVERGMVLAKPGSITPHTTSEAEVYVLTKEEGDRKSTRLNSSHSQISYAVFCLKKKKIQQIRNIYTGEYTLKRRRCEQYTITRVD